MEEIKHICKYCGKEFESGRALGSHYLHCSENPNVKNISKKATESRSYNHRKILRSLTCVVCGKTYELYVSDNDYLKGKYRKCCSHSCSSKLTLMHSDVDDINKKKSDTLKMYYKDKLKKHFCEYCGKEFTSDERGNSKYCSDVCMYFNRKLKLSLKAKEHGLGGFVENSVNASHQGWYKNIHCDSSWELAFVLWNELHNNTVKRYKGYVTYFYNNKEYKYYPDFIVNDVDIYEIKGYYSEQAKAKHEQHPEIKMLTYTEMIPIINEVKSIYGNDFIKLYNAALV